MPATRKPGDGYNYANVQMPCPDNYYYKKGQAEVEFWDKSSGYLGFPEFVVVWNRLQASYARQAIQSFQNMLSSGSWQHFLLLSPYDYRWVDMMGVLLEPIVGGITGDYVNGFSLHFVKIGAYGLGAGSGSIEQSFSYGGGSQAFWEL